MAGYEVNSGLLSEAAKGINDTIAELKTLGIAEAADEGRGFSGLEMTGLTVGNQGLRSAFAGFCDRWSWGVRSLVKDGDEIAQRLGLSAGAYHDAEQYAIGALKDAENAAVGDPHASDQQVEGESAGQIVSTAATPDFSAASWQKTGQDAKATWSGVGRDMAEGPMGLSKTVADQLGDGQRFTASEDQLFGPPPDSRQ